jgi:hypothetical protein
LCLGHGVRREPPHKVIMARGRAEDLVLRDLRRQVDGFEDASDVAGDIRPDSMSPPSVGIAYS